MELLHEIKSYTTEKGEVKEYISYYVVVYGINVYLKPTDITGSNLLSSVIKEG